MLAEERVRACRSWARTGPCRSIPWVVSAADRGARAAWTLSRARCNNPCKISFAQTWRPVQPPVIILPEPGAVVRFAACNTCNERGERRQPGGHFWRPLAREGVTRQKSLVLATFSQQRRARPATGRLRCGNVPGGALGAAPELSHKPGSGGARACP